MTSAASNGGTDRDVVRPEAIELGVVEWLRTELADEEITSSDNFVDVGGHSLTFTRLNTFLDDSYGVALDMRITYEESLAMAVAKMNLIDRPSPASPEEAQ